MVEHLGALHLHRGRLWLGLPRGVKGTLPLGRWMGLCLRPDGIRSYENGPIPRRRTAWDEITAVTVGFDGRAVFNLPASSALTHPADPRRTVCVMWERGNAWNRYVMLLESAWDGEVTEPKLHALRQLPDALRRRPELRTALASADSIADLLARLAASPDVAAVDAVLNPP